MDPFWIRNGVVGFRIGIVFAVLVCWSASWCLQRTGSWVAVRLIFRFIMCAYQSVQPALQAFRAEVMVERFTARMHVLVVVGGARCLGKFVSCQIFLGPRSGLECENCIAHEY